jgi:hypothetical protein
MEISGKLRMDLGKWEIAGDDGSTCVLSSGSVCELQIAGHWIRTRLEFCHGWYDWKHHRPVPPTWPAEPACGAKHEHRGHYYALERGVLLCEGLPARVTP